MGWIFLKTLFSCFTRLGKIRLFLFFFQVLLFYGIANSIYSSSQNTFECSTHQPGCQTVCNGAFAALSPISFWLLQIVTTTAPFAVYLSYAIHKIIHKKEEKPWIIDGMRGIQQEGLRKVYILQLMSRLVFEAGFLIGQYFLYGFEVSPSFICSHDPCPHWVICYVSRSAEKTVFLRITYAVSVLFFCLTLVEFFHLAFSCVTRCKKNNRLNMDKIQKNSHGITSVVMYREGLRV